MFNFITLKSIFSNFNAMNFVHNLKYMLTGMVAIFLVIAVIVLLTMFLNRMFSNKK